MVATTSGAKARASPLADSRQSRSSRSSGRKTSRRSTLPSHCGAASRRAQGRVPLASPARLVRATTRRLTRSQHTRLSRPFRSRTLAISRKRPHTTTLKSCITTSVSASSARVWISVPVSTLHSTTNPRNASARAEPSTLKQPHKIGCECQLPIVMHCQQREVVVEPSSSTVPSASWSQILNVPSREAVTNVFSLSGWDSATVTSAVCAVCDRLSSTYFLSSSCRHHFSTYRLELFASKRSVAG
mmetsp:Transcript_97050/g.274890  ORF Transcript_97050/g.274890 Transcript_97050/m.274890 type:complete len:244 (-) Transcript_97050:113-844(-)